MIEMFFASLLQCVMIQDFEEFSQCIDDLVIEYTINEKKE